MKWLSLGRGVAAVVLLQGCTHSVHLNHTSDFQTHKPLAKVDVVESRAEQVVVWGVATDTLYVDAAFQALMSQCDGGRLTGIQTRYSTSHSFFHWTNVVAMKGYCVR